MANGYLTFIKERSGDTQKIIAVVNRTGKTQVYNKLKEYFPDLTRRELLHRFPYEDVYSDEFKYNSDTQIVTYQGKSYVRNPEKITLSDGTTLSIRD